MPKHHRKGNGILRLLANCTEPKLSSDDNKGAEGDRNFDIKNGSQLEKKRLSVAPIGKDKGSRSKDSILRRVVDSLLSDRSESWTTISRRINGYSEVEEKDTGANLQDSRELRKRLLVALLDNNSCSASTEHTVEPAANIKLLLRRLNDIVDNYSGSSSGVGSGSGTSGGSSVGCGSGSGSTGNKFKATLTSTNNQELIVATSQWAREQPPEPPARLVSAKSKVDSSMSKHQLIDAQAATVNQWLSEDNLCAATLLAKPVFDTTEGPIYNVKQSGQQGLLESKSTRMVPVEKIKQYNSKVCSGTCMCEPNSRRYRPRGFRRYRCPPPQASGNYQKLTPAEAAAMVSSGANINHSRCCQKCCCCCGGGWAWRPNHNDDLWEDVPDTVFSTLAVNRR